MSDHFIPYGRQSLDESDIREVVKILQSDYLTTGPAVTDFEKQLCQCSAASHAVAVSSGTAALHAAYFAAGLQSGDEIITTPLTFAATANAALYLGATMRFVDIDPATGNLDPCAVEAAITSKTRLIVPVDFTGLPADYQAINAIAQKHGLLVVADGAHSLGASCDGKPVGTLADLTTTSFHPVKPVTTAEGGAVLTGNADFAARAQTFRTHGITRDQSVMHENQGPWWYEMHDLGYNYRLSDIHCALGISQLRKLETFIKRRKQIAGQYTQHLASHESLILPVTPTGYSSGWHLYVVRIRDGAPRRKAIVEYLHQQKIGVQIHYIPVHYHPYYQLLGFQRGSLPQAETFYEQCLSLPIFPAMTDADVVRVIDVLEQALKTC